MENNNTITYSNGKSMHNHIKKPRKSKTTTITDDTNNNKPLIEKLHKFKQKVKPRSKLEFALWIFILILFYLYYYLGYKIKVHIDYNSNEITMKVQHDQRKNNFIYGGTSSSSVNNNDNVIEGIFDDNIGDDDGFAACLLILDDHDLLTEWLAYHYTTLPLRRLIIGLDPKNSKTSVNQHYKIASQWNNSTKLNITIWPSTHFANYSDCRGVNKILCERYKGKRLYDRYKPFYTFSVHQRDLNLNCLWEHKTYYHYAQDKKEQEARNNDHKSKMKNSISIKEPSSWVLCTDTDEYLTYNYIKPKHENYSRYEWQEKKSSKKISEIDGDREYVAPLRKLYPKFINRTILSFMNYINDNKEIVNNYWFPNCLHSVGLFFNNHTTWEHDKNKRILLTQEYKYHQKEVNGFFSKAMIDVSRIEYRNLWKRNWDTIHNPSVGGCGRNFPVSAGIDYMSSVFRLNHYIGSIDIYYKRDGDTREYGNAEKRYMEKVDRYGPYDNTNSDDTMIYWMERFITLVGGKENANTLLNDYK